MALILQDRVRETTNTTGTGTFTLLGAVTGYQSFSVIGNGNTCFYACADQGGPNWEVGLGTYSSGTLARTTVLSSSNSGSLVNFTAGTKDVFVTQPSEKAVYLDGSGNITPSSVGPLTVSSLTDSGLTSGRVTYATTGGLLTDSANMTFNGTTVTMANDASISGLTVGKGGGSVSGNTVVGNSAMSSNTSGTHNTGFGFGTVNTNTTGTDNTGLGWAAVNSTTTGSNNTGVGSGALINNTTASNNTAVGYQAGYSNTTGASNTSLGRQAGYALAAGLQNTAVGANAMDSGDASYSVAVGYTALSANSGSYNVAVGNAALKANTTASNNTAVGYQAGYTNQTGTHNTAIGGQALYLNTANNNTALGFTTLYSNSTGTSNTGLGYETLYANTTGSYNTAVGQDALVSNTTASNNTAVGYQAGYTNTVGQYNVFMGWKAGYAYTGALGGNNTFVGQQAGIAVTTGYGNSFYGVASGSAITTGFANTIIGGYTGNQGGLDIRTASNYIVLSDGDGNPRGYCNASGFWMLGVTNSSYTNGVHTISNGSSEGTAIISVFTPTINNGTTFFNCNGGGSNAAATVMKIDKNSSTNRSINAGGTVNAAGLDYAEYMEKAGDFTIAKGDICGIDANGKLTNVFADAISFVVKSTNPSYVGGDIWGADLTEEELEAARQTVDRIAFAGQVPVNVTGATAGQYIIPVNNNGSISGQAVSNPTFEQYQIAVGKVISVKDGKPTIIVKVA